MGTHTWMALVSAVSCEMAHGEWDPSLPAQALLWPILLLQLMWGGEGGNLWHLLSLQHSPGMKALLS